MDNKVKFGLKNCHYATMTETEVAGIYTVAYETPVPLLGAVTLDMDPKGDKGDFFADDRAYHTETTNQGYSGNLEIANVPDSFLQTVLGQIKDSEGAIFEHKDAKINNMALMFEIDGDKTKTRYLFYKVVPGRFKIGSKTKTNATDPVTDTISIEAMESPDTGYIKAKSVKGDVAYDSWYQAVHVFKAVGA